MKLQPRRRRDEKGFSLAIVLGCLTLLSMLLGAAFQSTMLRSKRQRLEERRIQADWLAESGLERAASAIEKNSEYAGEQWQVSPQELGGADAGLVQIRIAPIEGRPQRRRAAVIARYPAGLPQEAAAFRELEIPLTEGKN